MYSENPPAAVRQIIDEFIADFVGKEDTLAIILAGSYAYGQPSEHSDVDLHIILGESQSRKRGNTWIGDIEIEYFINPVNQVEAYLEEDRNALRPTTAHMLHFGQVIYQKEDTTEVDKLLQIASDIIESPFEQLEKERIELFKYALDDIRKDLRDAKLDENLIAYHMTAMLAVKTSLEAFLRINQSRQNKPKNLEKQLSTIDPEFQKRYHGVFESNYGRIQIEELITYTETQLGGRRSKEWSLETPLTVEGK